MSGPHIRTVDALTGAKAPTAFFQALSEADHFCREQDEVQRLRDVIARCDKEIDEWIDEALEAREQRDELQRQLQQAEFAIQELQGRLASFRGAGDAR